ncbi:hypothetical protein AOT82_2115 [Psychrobacter sp. AntiMn-1]|nr:hypothetical protein AOT82_2115 [Psychrobacter sp. AntiMn-1]
MLDGWGSIGRWLAHGHTHYSNKMMGKPHRFYQRCGHTTRSKSPL